MPDSDITAEEAAYWWKVRAFREYRQGRKCCTNQTNPWPSDRGLIEEFLALYPEVERYAG